MATDISMETFYLFFDAINQGNENKIRALVDVGVDVNIKVLPGQTALLYAVQHSSKSVVCTLIDAGADVNITNDDGQTALFYAVQQSNNEGVVRAMIDAGADVNKTDEFGGTALLHAVQKSNNKSVVCALIDAGADVNKTYDNGKTALVYAVQQSNNESMVCALIDAGADVNKTYDNGKTALVYAVQQSNNESMVRALVDAGADVNKTDEFGRTVLLHAVHQSNNESVVRALIDGGADVNKTDGFGGTALLHAVQLPNNESVVRALIDAGADVNKTDEFGRTPLFHAVHQSNSESVVHALIDGGADVNIEANYNDYDEYCGSTALLHAVQQPNNESVVHSLIDAGADVNKTDECGRTPLFHAVHQSNSESVVHALIDGGADVNIEANYHVYDEYCGSTALLHAIQQPNNESVVRSLIDADADVNKTDEFGRTALLHAVRRPNNESVVRALIDAGADVNIKANYNDYDEYCGSTALLHAIQQPNNESVVRSLIDAGADVNKTDEFGVTALFHAVHQSNNESVVRALIDAGADVNIEANYNEYDEYYGSTALLHAVQQPNKESVVRSLIDAGADVNKTDEFGGTALFHAVHQSNNESVVHALIDAGADVNKSYEFGATALFYAVQESNNESVVRALIDAGADVNKTDECGATALFYAVQESNNESVVRALIDAGADVNKTDDFDRTALFYAVLQTNNESVVRALIDAGADVNKTDECGATALFCAVQESNESVVRALIDAGGASVNVQDAYGRTPLFYALDYPQSAGILVEKGTKDLFHLRDTCNCSILNFFVEKHLFDESNWYCRRLFHVDSQNEDIPSGFFDLLEECEIQKVTFAEAIFNIAFCKFPLIFQTRRESMQPNIARALKLANQFIDNQEDIKTLIALINEKCKNGEGVSEALNLLVKLGADPNSVDSDGNTALHYASSLALMGVPQEVVMGVCLQLEKLNVQYSRRNHDNETPLLYCFSRGVNNLDQENQLAAVKTLVDVCRFLLKHVSSFAERSGPKRSDIAEMRHLKMSFGRNFEDDFWEKPQLQGTVLHLILKLFKKGLLLSDEKARQEVLNEEIKLLHLFSPTKVTKSGIIDIPDHDNCNSPLHWWAILELPSPQGYTSKVTRDLTFQEFLQEILNYLKECGAVMNARNRLDQTALHLCRTWIAVKLLLDAGARANDVDSSGASPLMVAAKKKSLQGSKGCFYPDVSEIEEPKAFWKTATNKGLDPWTADKEGNSVLSILIKEENFVLAKALVDIACEERHTQSEAFAVGLLNAICKDKSTLTMWKLNLVQDILKSRKGPTTSCEPLRLCCSTIRETGILDKEAEKKYTSSSSALKMIASEEDEEQPRSKKRRLDTSDHSIELGLENTSVHCEIIKILRLYGADGSSCLDMADTSDAFKALLTKPLDLSTVPELIPWTSISKKHEVKLGKVARRQECNVIHEEFWCHKEHIGSGSFGHVFVGINEKDGREVAIKRIEKVRMQGPKDKREITNLTALADCEQIVRYLHFFEEEKFAYIILELMEGDLDEYLTDHSTFDATKSTQLCEDVVKGLKFLHAQDIIHRDLKPGNILYKTHPHHLKIADFGLSRRLESIATTVYCTNAGTRCWMAPELLKLQGTDHSKTSDMFSCGLVLHYILSVQKHPFNKNNNQVAHQIETNIANGKMEGWDDSLSPEASHIIKNMLRSDEKDRPTAGEALDHPFFWSNWKKVDFLKAVGNQPVFEYPRARKSTCLTAVEADLEKTFSTIVAHGNWNDPRYKCMPHIYAEMTRPRRRSYDIHSVVELVRFIRNAYAHVSEATRPTPIKKLLLEDFVFLEYFPHLVMEAFKVVTDHGWDQTVEEIKYAMNK